MNSDRCALEFNRGGSGAAPARLRASNDFDAYWEFHEQQESERHHASTLRDHRVPDTVPSRSLIPAQPSRPAENR